VTTVLPTRFGIVWGAGFVAWLVALLTLLAPLSSWSAAGLVPRDATLGATGAVLPRARTRTRWPMAAIGIPLLALLTLPALAGHATIQHPVALFAPVNVIHVAAMSVWLGGLVGLLTGALTLPLPEPGDPAVGTRTLAAALARFSPIALACVGLLIATGIVQALIEVSAWSQFIDTGYGRAILVKVASLVVLIALGARQRRRTIPAVDASAAAGAAPAKPLRLLLQTLGAELVALAVVLGAVGPAVATKPAEGSGMRSDKDPHATRSPAKRI
jgi:copper transport protein